MTKCAAFGAAVRRLHADNRVGGVHLLRVSAVLEKAHTASVGKNAAMKLWHVRLGHADKRAIARMAAKPIVRGLVMTNTSKVTEYDPCTEGKMSNGSMPSKAKLRGSQGEVVLTDVCTMQTV